MCGRYTLATPDPAAVRARFPIGEQIEIRRRFNIAPADNVLAVTTDREGRPRGELLRWGLVPSWADGPGSGLKLINARAETVAERPAFRGAFERFRCLIPADGFYEWSAPAGGARKRAFHIARSDRELLAFREAFARRRCLVPFDCFYEWQKLGKERQPYAVGLADRRLMALAGLWETWRSPAGERVRSFAIVTTAANPEVARLHDRMPVILPADAEAAWLDPGTPRAHLRELLAPLPSDQTAVVPVGPAVNDARYDGPECLAPAGQAGSTSAPPQATLF